MALTDSVPSAAFDVLQRNAQDVDKFANSSSTLVNRVGNNIKSIPLLESEAQTVIDSLGFVTLDPLTFETGATITSKKQLLEWAVADGGNGFHYYWSGALPKTVTASSTPASSGGTGAGAWLIQDDLEQRISSASSDVLVGAVEAKYNSVESMSTLLTLGEPNNDRVECRLVAFHGDWAATLEKPTGGGTLVWDASKPKSEHNGFTVIDPDNTADLLTWDATEQEIWFTPAASGTGCWVRADTELTVEMAGAKHYPVSSSRAMQAALDSFTPGVQAGGKVSLTPEKKYYTDDTIVILSNIVFDHKDAAVFVDCPLGFQLGNNASLCYNPQLLNVNLYAVPKICTLIKKYGVRGGKITGNTEGFFQPFDDPDRYIESLHVDAGDQSNFFTHISLNGNHVNVGVRTATSGSTFSTSDYFENCNFLCDNVYGAVTSIGFNVGSDNGLPEGQGMQIVGGNLEQCIQGIRISENAGPVNIMAPRFETGSNDIDIYFRERSNSYNVVVGVSLAANIMWDQPEFANTIIINEDGSMGVPDGKGQMFNSNIRMKPTSGQFSILSEGDATSTDRFIFQAGAGSASFGAGVIAHAAAHATYPGQLQLASVSGRDLVVTDGLFGGAIATIGDQKLQMDLPTYADDASAGAGGLAANRFYKTATGEIRIKL